MTDTHPKTCTQDLHEWEAHCEQIARQQDEALDAAIDAAYEAARILAPHFNLIYAYGDGRGGWLLDTFLVEAGMAENAPLQSKQPKQLKQSVRTKVMERDAYRCCYCGTHLHLSIDHIHPRSKGGTDDLDNLQTLCRSCNSSKGAKVIDNEQ